MSPSCAVHLFAKIRKCPRRRPAPTAAQRAGLPASRRRGATRAPTGIWEKKENGHDANCLVYCPRTATDLCPRGDRAKDVSTEGRRQRWASGMTHVRWQLNPNWLAQLGAAQGACVPQREHPPPISNPARQRRRFSPPYSPSASATRPPFPPPPAGTNGANPELSCRLNTPCGHTHTLTYATNYRGMQQGCAPVQWSQQRTPRPAPLTPPPASSFDPCSCPVVLGLIPLPKSR